MDNAEFIATLSGRLHSRADLATRREQHVAEHIKAKSEAAALRALVPLSEIMFWWVPWVKAPAHTKWMRADWLAQDLSDKADDLHARHVDLDRAIVSDALAYALLTQPEIGDSLAMFSAIARLNELGLRSRKATLTLLGKEAPSADLMANGPFMTQAYRAYPPGPMPPLKHEVTPFRDGQKILKSFLDEYDLVVTNVGNSALDGVVPEALLKKMRDLVPIHRKGTISDLLDLTDVSETRAEAQLCKAYAFLRPVWLQVAELGLKAEETAAGIADYVCEELAKQSKSE